MIPKTSILSNKFTIMLKPHPIARTRWDYEAYAAIPNDGRRLGFVLNAPEDVELTVRDVVQPDLVIVSKSRSEILVPTRVKGIPDWVIEILSPSNADYDLTTKRQLYERCGVPGYWMVDPVEHKVIRLVLSEGMYQESSCVDEITFSLPPSVRVDLNKVW